MKKTKRRNVLLCRVKRRFVRSLFLEERSEDQKNNMEKEIKDEQKICEGEGSCCSWGKGKAFFKKGCCGHIVPILFLFAFVGAIFCIGFTAGNFHNERNGRFERGSFGMMQNKGGCKCGNLENRGVNPLGQVQNETDPGIQAQNQAPTVPNVQAPTEAQ
jgi:hypothetical protein